MHKNPGIALTRTLALSVSLLGLLLALALPTAPSAHAEVGCGAAEIEQLQHEGRTLIQEEQLRSENHSTGLPDCRAYEQVSPTFKNGFGATFQYLSPDGEQVDWESPGAFAGAVGGEGCAINEFKTERTSTGWVTSALNDAPLSEFDSASKNCAPHLLGDSGASLSLLRPVSGSVYARNVYIHEPDGSFELVGPTIPPSAVLPSPTGPGEAGGFQPGGDFLDATPNLEHVLFTLEAQSHNLAPGVKTELWPGDTTQLVPSTNYTPSLYEYAGTNNKTPTLVGVDNSGHLISNCGTAPGGWDGYGNGNHLNVISEDGSRVFFTAVGHHPECAAGVAPPVFELYARLNSGQPQSPVDAQGHCTVVADACTVAISEPGADTDCTETCAANATNETDFRDANYEKASRDGSKVFFTSTQQLLNNASQDSNPADSAVPREGQKGCDATPGGVSSGITGADGCNLYEYDFEENRATGAPIGLVLVSGGDSSGLGPEVQGVAAVSEDGSHVYFVARGVLAKNSNAYGNSAVAGAENLYVNNTSDGRTAFVAALAESDDKQWTYDAGGKVGHPMDVTDDGSFLVFTSWNHLTPGDASTVPQVFRYAAKTGELVRISLGNEGHEGLGTSGISARVSVTTSAPEPLDSDSHPAVSEDGTIVVFASSEALVPQALTNNKCEKEEEGNCKSYINNIYEYRDGHVYLIAGNAVQEAPVVSESGHDIVFITHERLTPSDVDTVKDIYDARSDGGFPAAAAAAPCSGQDCQGPVGAAPVFGAPTSASLTGNGDLVPPAPAVAPKPKAKPLTRAQKLANALRTCRQKRKKARTSCEAAARRKYAPARKANSDRRPAR